MAPMPTLEALSWYPGPGQELLFLGVRASADGLMADGTPGRLTVVQTAISGHTKLPGKDGWPAERVIVRPVDD